MSKHSPGTNWWEILVSASSIVGGLLGLGAAGNKAAKSVNDKRKSRQQGQSGEIDRTTGDIKWNRKKK